MSTLSGLARSLAVEADKLEAMEGFKSNNFDIAPRAAKVSWSDGSATTGYEELARAMSTIVTQRFMEIRDEAVTRQREVVGAIRAQLVIELNNAAAHGDTSVA
jgi:hypothetical protein